MRIFNENMLRNFINNSKKLVILAIGNPLRNDDSVGVYLGSELMKVGVPTIIAEVAPESYYFKIIDSGYSDVIIIDAVRAPYPPGTIIFVDKEDLFLYPATTHDIPITLFLELLEKANINYLIIGIVPKNIEFGEHISPEVKKSADYLLDILKKMISKN